MINSPMILTADRSITRKPTRKQAAAYLHTALRLAEEHDQSLQAGMLDLLHDTYRSLINQPKKAKTPAAWLALALARKGSARSYLQHLFAHDGYLYATNAARCHRLKYNIADGIYAFAGDKCGDKYEHIPKDSATFKNYQRQGDRLRAMFDAALNRAGPAETNLNPRYHVVKGGLGAELRPGYVVDWRLLAEAEHPTKRSVYCLPKEDALNPPLFGYHEWGEFVIAPLNMDRHG